MSKTLKKISKESYPIEICTEDFSKDPVFAAKHEKAEKFIAKYGIPQVSNEKPKVKVTKRQKT